MSQKVTSQRMTIFILAIASTLCPVLSDPVVSAPKGTFLGTELTSRKDKTYYGFRGIPYAQPPVGDLRFRAPLPADPVEGVYNATTYKPFCIQFSIIPFDFGAGQEDCLYLNIDTPKDAAESQALKKVIFFIHGGGNANGFPDFYKGGNLVSEYDVILVVPAFRLGYLGFLSTMTSGCEGNFGLKDLLLALEWVKENIRSFGGDPDDITIAGVSAGGIDVSLMSLMPQSKDLFTKVYAQSGVAGYKFSSLIKDPQTHAISTARQFGCLTEGQNDPATEEELNQIADCLRTLPELTFYVNEPGPLPVLGPVLYGDLFPKDVPELLADEEYLKSIKFSERSYMVGVNENEGAIFDVIADGLGFGSSEEQKQAFLFGLVQQFTSSVFGPISPAVTQKIVEYYTNNHDVGPTADYSADAIFHFPNVQFAEIVGGDGSSRKSKMYLFRFVHQPDFVTGSHRGLVHGCDMLYFFELDLETADKMLQIGLDSSKWSEEDDLLTHKYSTMITDFMKTGDPSKSIPGGWPAYDREGQYFLQFGLNPELKQIYLPEHIKIWRELIPRWMKEFPVEQAKKEEL